MITHSPSLPAIVSWLIHHLTVSFYFISCSIKTLPYGLASPLAMLFLLIYFHLGQFDVDSDGVCVHCLQKDLTTM